MASKMMLMCDRCGRNGDDVLLNVLNLADKNGTWRTYDFCDDCCDDLREWMLVPKECAEEP